MNAIDRLDEIEARANAATRGPWATVIEDGVTLSLVLTDEDDGLFYGDSGYDAPIVTESGRDAEFVAHARTDVPALVAALRAMLEAHTPHECVSSLAGDDPCLILHGGACALRGRCRECHHTHPCPTVRAIEEALS